VGRLTRSIVTTATQPKELNISYNYNCFVFRFFFFHFFFYYSAVIWFCFRADVSL
jgi:hypothetical protein